MLIVPRDCWSNRYFVSWFGSLVLLLISIVMFAEHKMVTGIISFSVVMVVGIILEYFRKKNQIEVVDLGKVKYNLNIEIQCHKRVFDKTMINSVEDEIEKYGLAIHRARKLLKGNWRVTDKGYLIRGFVQNVESHVATLEIDDVMPGLVVLEKVLNGAEWMWEDFSSVHIHFKEGRVAKVGINGTGLYLF